MKRISGNLRHKLVIDAPHTGARLETGYSDHLLERRKQDAPHTGARLETSGLQLNQNLEPGCPPHGGTT